MELGSRDGSMFFCEYTENTEFYILRGFFYGVYVNYIKIKITFGGTEAILKSKLVFSVKLINITMELNPDGFNIYLEVL